MNNTDYKSFLSENYNGLTYAIKTYGCQMNVNDSMKIRAVLDDCGFKMIGDIHTSDISILNTCCVRENAENKALGLVGSLKRDKQDSKQKIIIVLGCMTQQEGYLEKFLKTHSFVDIILGTSDGAKLPSTIYKALNRRKTVTDLTDPTKPIDESLISVRDGRVSEFVTIMTGCNNFCTYCSVPYVRGRERSRAPKNIIDEIKLLIKNGTKEIVLLGQNVNSYGIGLHEKCDFSDLINMITEETDIKRLRFMTSHPKDLSDKLIETIANNDVVCNHIHLPVQAGSNAVLKSMNRNYTIEKYIDLFNKLKSSSDDITLTTDIIVGFPGESETDFEDTLKVVKEVGFTSAFMFKYSKRTGTPAYDMENQVDEDVKVIRLQKLIETQEKISENISKSYIGKSVQVLIENKSTKSLNKFTGKTPQNITVYVEDNKNIKIGDLVNVTINHSKKHTLIGYID